YTPVSATSETLGRPSAGAVGIQKTTAEVMHEQSMAPDVDKGIRLMPEREGFERRGLPQSPGALAQSSYPFKDPIKKPTKGRVTSTIVKPGETPTLDVITPRAPQTVSTPNFTAATLADTGAFPPDTMGAVGPT